MITRDKRAAQTKLLPHQQELLDSTEREVLVTGGRGSGMSWGLHAWLNASPERALLVVQSHPSRRFLPKGYKFQCCYLEYLAHLRGKKYLRIAFDIPAPDLLRETYLKGPWDVNARFVIATPPAPNGMKHWIAKRFLNGSHPDRRVIWATLKDNPYLDNPDFNSRYRRMLGTLFPSVQRRWLDGEWEAEK